MRRPKMACVEHNKHMGGVDLGDQHRGYYHIQMKCRKFYKYIAIVLFDVTVTNSFILYNISHDRPRISDKCWLWKSYSEREPIGRSHIIRPLPLLHFPVQVPAEN